LYPLQFICKSPLGFQTDLNPIITSLHIADVTYKPLLLLIQDIAKAHQSQAQFAINE